MEASPAIILGAALADHHGNATQGPVAVFRQKSGFNGTFACKLRRN